MITNSVHYKDIIKLNVNASISRAWKYMKQKLAEVTGKMDKYTITVGDFNTPFSVTVKTNRKSVII